MSLESDEINISDKPLKPVISNKNLTKRKNLEFFEGMRDSVETQIKAKLIEIESSYKLRSLLDEYCELVKPENTFKIRECVKESSPGLEEIKNNLKKARDLDYIVNRMFNRINNLHVRLNGDNEVFNFYFSVELKAAIKSNIELLKEDIERFEREVEGV